jgi:serine/threonine-protein kinase HipA
MSKPALKTEHQLTVLFHDTVAGHLRLIDGKLSFSYDAQYLVNPQATKLSFALPLQADAFSAQASKAFFGGLLPEGKLRTLLSKQFGVSKQNDFALLKEIGGECAGAVSLVLSDEQTDAQTNDSIKWLSKSELATLIEQLPQRPMMAGQDGLRLSLAGAQDKLPVRVAALEDLSAGASIGLPSKGILSTFILKPPIPSISHSVSNEFFCMSLSNTVNIFSPKCLMIKSKDTALSFLLVSRYDREQAADTAITRLHQEDFCQALGISSEAKYQNEGGPSLRDCFTLVRQATNNSATSTLSLLDYVLFNTLVGNHDAHGKNFSLLYQNSKTTIAPLYDCLSTAIYPTLTEKMAMSIGGKYKFSELHAKHWEQFAADVGLSVALAAQRLKIFAKVLPKQARALQNNDTVALADKATVETICQLIEHRCALTLKRLS